MTLKQFALRTGWPYEELLQTGSREFFEILEFMGMTWTLKPGRKPMRTNKKKRKT